MRTRALSWLIVLGLPGCLDDDAAPERLAPVGEGEGEAAEGEGEQAEGEGELGEGEGEAAEGEGEGEGAGAEGEGEVAEGEGEGGEGEGEGAEGEGEGEGAEGEGEGEGDPPDWECDRDDDCPEGRLCAGLSHRCVGCLRNADCPRGTLCAASECVEGCAVDRDCPDGLHCPEDGSACVECVIDEHCIVEDEPARCGDDHRCVAVCDQDHGCEEGRCDLGAGVCVECLGDGECSLGEVCEGLRCEAGCRDARDCPEDLRCDPGIGCIQCVEDRHCPTLAGVGRVCEAGECRPGCEEASDCRAGQVCHPDSRACTACGEGAPCGDGLACLVGGCQLRCADDGGCPGEDLHCTDAGVCVDCLNAEHCDGAACLEGGSCELVPANHRIAVIGQLDLHGPLRAAGFETVRVGPPEIRNQWIIEQGFDALFLGRQGASFHEQEIAGLAAFMAGGGGLVTEWEGLVPLFSAHHPTSRSRNLHQAGWWEGQVGGGVNLGPATPIRFIDPSSPVLEGIEDPLADAGGTQFFYTIYSEDPSLRTVATFRGNGTLVFPDQDFPAVIETRFCDAPVVILPFDYQDAPNSPAIARLITNAARVAVSPVDANLTGPCPE